MIIYKYPLRFMQDRQELVEVQIPFGAEYLDVQLQYEQVVLWALVDPKAALVARKFLLVGTGLETAQLDRDVKYLATFQVGAFVGHVFEVLQ